MNLSLAFVHSKIEALDLYHLYYVVHNVPNALFEVVDGVLFQLSSFEEIKINMEEFWENKINM